MSQYHEEVRKLCRQALAGPDLNYSELARQVGHSHTYWSNRLKPGGKDTMSLNDLLAIAKAADVDVTDLFPPRGTVTLGEHDGQVPLFELLPA